MVPAIVIYGHCYAGRFNSREFIQLYNQHYAATHLGLLRWRYIVQNVLNITMRQTDVIVIGAGIGGLTTAALLAKDGYRVTVLEGQTYPGGSAGTFTHQGFRFEAGATVAGGFQREGPHSIVGKLLDLDWNVHRHDPAWVVHLPDRSIRLTGDYADVLAKFPGTAEFWEEQRQVADLAWKMSAQGLPWPPRSLAELLQLAKVGLQQFPHDLQLIPYMFGSVFDWLRSKGLEHHTVFKRFLDGQLLISAQTVSENVNALYGATALDLARQGVYHVEGGIGGIAETLVQKLQAFGGQIAYRQRVTRIEVERGQVTGVYVRQGRRGRREIFIPADFVIANTTPWNLSELLDENVPRSLKAELRRRKYGWGAFVLHLGVDEAVFPPDFPDHHQVIEDMDSPPGETHSIFVSISPAWDKSRAPKGQRAVTITTHTDVQQWWELLRRDEAAYYARKETYTRRILQHMERLLPGFQEHLTLTLPGTPVTYQFYTDRHLGQVGGFPQTSLFKMRGPRTGIPNLRLVGDSIFPGQSTAGVTLGAIRVWRDVRHSRSIFTDKPQSVGEGETIVSKAKFAEADPELAALEEQ
jgi:C-3',4' desaturase CrtD